jgi:hypothetical protein
MQSIRIIGFGILLSSFALGQVDTGIIAGTVRDASGGVVPNAKVSIENQGTGQVVEIATNTRGIYVSPPLRPGEYTVRIEAAGFEKVAKRMQVDVSQRAVLDFELKIGAVAQEVTVQGVVPVLQTETSTLSNLRTERAIKDLPLNGRNFAQLLQLAAGVMPAQTQQSGSPITMKRGVTGNSVNGTRLEENNFLVDGISNAENHNGLGILIFPSIDAIAEFRIESSVADAQFGRGGGTVNLTYKSGTVDFHGGLYEFLRNSRLDAKNFFDRPGERTPPFKQNQFGGFLGGPLFSWKKEKKTFFFTNYEGSRVRQAQTLTSTVPTAGFRQGDFSAASQKIFDPLTQRQTAPGQFVRDEFPGNRVPADRLDAVGKNILSLYPLPNLGTGVANNFLFNPVRKTTGDKFDFKVDRIFSERDTVFVRHSYSSDDLIEPSFLPAPAVGNGPGVPGPAEQPVNQVVLSETHIFSPSKSNEFRFGWTRLNLRAFNLNFGRNVSQEIGVPGGNVLGDQLTSGLSIFNVSGFRDLGDNGFSPAVIVSDNLEPSDNFNYVRGKHTFKFGGEVQRRRYNAFQSNVLRGSMSFSGTFTQNPASSAGTGLGAADVLLGRPISGQIRFLNGTRGFRRTELGFYAQDVYKATAKLTLNFGLRYENFVGWPWTEVSNRMYQFAPDLQDVVRVGTGQVPWQSGIPGDNNDFSPRVGLAYRPVLKTVVRAGYGLYYSAPQWDVTRNLAANPPEFIVSAFTNDQFNFLDARPAFKGFDRPAQGAVQGTLRAIDTAARTPYTQQWNITIQRELPAAVSLTVAYVGTKGTKLQGFPDVNQAVPGTGPVSSRRPFPHFDGISTIQTRFESIYHGLQITAERRFARGPSFLAAYTYSHSIDENSQFGDVIDFRNIRLDRGNADTDVRHRMVASWNYELPFRGSGPLKYLVEGWQINGILSLYDGLPFSVNSSTNTLNIGKGTRADRLREGSLPKSERTLQRWFDTQAFTAPALRQFGNSGRNILQGPGTKQLDFSAFKELYFTEGRARRLEFRSEFFNLTNTPQLNNPNATFGIPGFGTISSAGSPLTLQRTSRQIQFALKLYF